MVERRSHSDIRLRKKLRYDARAAAPDTPDGHRVFMELRACGPALPARLERKTILLKHAGTAHSQYGVAPTENGRGRHCCKNLELPYHRLRDALTDRTP